MEMSKLEEKQTIRRRKRTTDKKDCVAVREEEEEGGEGLQWGGRYPQGLGFSGGTS